MNNLLQKLTPPEPFGQCDSNFIGMFQTVRFIQIMSLTFGLFTQVSGLGPLGPLVFVPFSFFPDFSSKISPQPFKIETSNLVYRFTTTSCIVGLKMGLLLFVLPYVCFFFFLSRFFVKDISTTV